MLHAFARACLRFLYCIASRQKTEPSVKTTWDQKHDDYGEDLYDDDDENDDHDENDDGDDDDEGDDNDDDDDDVVADGRKETTNKMKITWMEIVALI